MKKILACLLALAMLVMVVALAGCGNNPVETTPAGTTAAPGTTAGTEPAQTTASTTGESTEPTGTTASATVPTETTAYIPDYTKDKIVGYEDLNFGGKKFVIAAQDDTSGDGWYTTTEVYPDTTLTDAISIAVRQRNALVEKLYNCKIEMNASDSATAVASADITGQKYTIDLYNAEYQFSQVWTSGNCYNLLDYIDVTNPWWDQNFVSAFAVKSNAGTKVLPEIIGDFSLVSFTATNALFFNKDVYENSGISDDIYDLVATGKWTMDKFVEMIKAATKDTSGNGTLAYADGDSMGWVRVAFASHAMHVASGLRIVENDDGVLNFAPQENVDEWNTVINKAIEVFKTEGAESIGYSSVQAAISEGKALFGTDVLDQLRRMKDVEGLRLGLVPFPKYTESQDGYSVYVDNHLAPYCMPITVTNPELTGDFFEVYAAHSTPIVREAFVQTYAYTYCGDSESYDTLQIILNNRSYDAGYYWWSDFESQFSSMITGGNNNVTKFAQRYAKTFATNYTDILNKFSAKYDK